MNDDSLDNIFIDFSNYVFAIRPNPTYSDLMRITDFAEDIGYEMPFREQGYSLEEVQEKLQSEGQSAFLELMTFQEDISPKAPPKTAQQFIAERLNALGPTSDLIIVDPYLFPTKPKLGVEGYAKYLAELISPIVVPDARVKCVVNTKANQNVIESVEKELASSGTCVSISITRTEHFHDRFWIADRSKGVVIGTSLNGLGGRVFFMDTLSGADVGFLVHELEGIGI